MVSFCILRRLHRARPNRVVEWIKRKVEGIRYQFKKKAEVRRCSRAFYSGGACAETYRALELERKRVSEKVDVLSDDINRNQRRIIELPQLLQGGRDDSLRVTRFFLYNEIYNSLTKELAENQRRLDRVDSDLERFRRCISIATTRPYGDVFWGAFNMDYCAR